MFTCSNTILRTKNIISDWCAGVVLALHDAHTLTLHDIPGDQLPIPTCATHSATLVVVGEIEVLDLDHVPLRGAVGERALFDELHAHIDLRVGLRRRHKLKMLFTYAKTPRKRNVCAYQRGVLCPQVISRLWGRFVTLRLQIGH